MVEQNPLGDLDLDGLFADIAKGNFGLDVPQLQQPQEQSPIGKSFRDTFITECLFYVLSPKNLRFLEREHVDIRLVADYFRKEFTQWKAANAQASLRGQKPDEAEIIKNLTYTDMSEFAKGRFEEFSKESGRSVPFSERQKQMQGLADYWGWVSQVTEEASDQEKKNPT